MRAPWQWCPLAKCRRVLPRDRRGFPRQARDQARRSGRVTSGWTDHSADAHELLAALQAVLDAEMLERLLAEGGGAR